MPDVRGQGWRLEYYPVSGEPRKLLLAVSDPKLHATNTVSPDTFTVAVDFPGGAPPFNVKDRVKAYRDGAIKIHGFVLDWDETWTAEGCTVELLIVAVPWKLWRRSTEDVRFKGTTDLEVIKTLIAGGLDTTLDFSDEDAIDVHTDTALDTEQEQLTLDDPGTGFPASGTAVTKIERLRTRIDTATVDYTEEASRSHVETDDYATNAGIDAASDAIHDANLEEVRLPDVTVAEVESYVDPADFLEANNVVIDGDLKLAGLIHDEDFDGGNTYGKAPFDSLLRNSTGTEEADLVASGNGNGVQNNVGEMVISEYIGAPTPAHLKGTLKLKIEPTAYPIEINVQNKWIARITSGGIEGLDGLTYAGTPINIPTGQQSEVIFEYDATDADPANWTWTLKARGQTVGTFGVSNRRHIDGWTSDAGITTGLNDVGWKSTPTVFNLGGETYLISGELDGIFNGWKWNTGTNQWDADAAITTGLTDVGQYSAPTVFDLGGETYLISGNNIGTFNGWKWNTGTNQWDADAAITTGLTDVGSTSTPTVFTLGGDTYLISGEADGVFTGWKWNTGTNQWDADAGITTGLTDVGAGSSPTVFDLTGETYLISGEGDGVFNGWTWNAITNQWDADAGITTGLGNIGTNSTPTVFTLAGQTYLISGEQIGVFTGWLIDAPYNRDHIDTPADQWPTYSSITTGLTDVGFYSAPTVFDLGGETYLISGEGDGVFNGWKWNTGTRQWDADAAITTGLSDVGANSTPTVFDLGGETYLISGELDGVFTGWKWNTGTNQWDADAAITTGLGDFGADSAPTGFNLGGETYLISGNSGGLYTGWKWNTGTNQWDADAAITTGLSDVGANSTPTVFDLGGETYLIMGEQAGIFTGWKWNTGTNQWDADAAITTGLSDVGANSTPTVFTLAGQTYLISGEYDGVFNGHGAATGPGPRYQLSVGGAGQAIIDNVTVYPGIGASAPTGVATWRDRTTPSTPHRFYLEATQSIPTGASTSYEVSFDGGATWTAAPLTTNPSSPNWIQAPAGAGPSIRVKATLNAPTFNDTPTISDVTATIAYDYEANQDRLLVTKAVTTDITVADIELQSATDLDTPAGTTITWRVSSNGGTNYTVHPGPGNTVNIPSPERGTSVIIEATLNTTDADVTPRIKKLAWRGTEATANTTVGIEVSRDGGTTWHNATKGVAFDFTSFATENPKTDFKIRFTLTTDDPTVSPGVRDVTVELTTPGPQYLSIGSEPSEADAATNLYEVDYYHEMVGDVVADIIHNLDVDAWWRLTDDGDYVLHYNTARNGNQHLGRLGATIRSMKVRVEGRGSADRVGVSGGT